MTFEFGQFGQMRFPVLSYFGMRIALPLQLQPAFVTTWKTDNIGPTNDDQIALPLTVGGTYDFEVDWGDDTSDTITAWDQAEKTHTYASAGTYTVTITGTIQGWAFGNLLDKLKILTIESWGPLDFGTNSGQFYGCTNLTSSAADSPTVGNQLANCFLECSNFNGPVANWDTSAVISMANMFSKTPFNQPLTNWDTGACTNFSGMFQENTVFDQDVSHFDTSSATAMQAMFRDCFAFDQDLSGWDVSNALTMFQMFLRASSFNSDISGWDTSSATHMLSMFEGATSFDQDLGGWAMSLVANVTDMFKDISLSTSNYDALLIGWAAQSLVSSLSFNGGGSKYTGGGAAEAARDDLLDPPESWTIVDGGIAP